jgi:hypothetical protein
MWRWIKRIVLLTVLLVVGLFFHYVLPQHDVVQVTNTYNRLTTVGANAMFYASPDAGTGEADTRDIRFIEAVRPNGKIIIYRNEDTGWVWPPYFKYDSSDLQGEAGLRKSTDTAVKWTVVRHYGWRIRWMSIYPNAVGVRAVDGPEVTIIPYFNIAFFVFLAFVVFMLRRMWAQFRERKLDPMLEDAGEAWDKVDDRADAAADKARGVWGRFRGWLGTWQGKPRG